MLPCPARYSRTATSPAAAATTANPATTSSPLMSPCMTGSLRSRSRANPEAHSHRYVNSLDRRRFRIVRTSSGKPFALLP